MTTGLERLPDSATVAGLAADRASYLSLFPAFFVLSLLVPVQLHLGSIILLPHRMFLLVAFFPMLANLFSPGQKFLLIDGLVLFATFWAALALLISGSVAEAIEPIGLFAVEFLGAYLVGRVCIRSLADFQRVVSVFFIALLLLTPLALIESVTHRPFILDILPNTYAPSYADPRMGLRRAQTVFAHPILFGVFVSTCFGLMVFTMTGGRRILGVGMAVLSSFLSLSTGAFISVIVQVGFIIWERLLRRVKIRWRIFGVLCMAGYMAIDLLSNRSPFHVLVSYASFSAHSAYNRILIWTYGTENVRENPLFGLGLNITEWSRPEWMSASADNFWLLMAMTYGLPMSIAFMGAVALIVRQLARANLKTRSEQSARASLLVAIGGIVIAGGTVHLWHTMLSFVMFVFGSGLWMIVGQTTEETNETVEEKPHDSGVRYTRFPSRS